ncbi:unnamed protein product [Cylindrotheca closterium]|uniref:Kinesin light chain n=1 Tax=Cylindrotheca closterium TaxID=2856 RepID=A0AAD2FNB6_9STRA|nr:unnamed protein product [Cylindrotheca closterium]
MVDRISTFNEMGASEFHSGHFETSEMCFCQAVSELGIGSSLASKGLRSSPQNGDVTMMDSRDDGLVVNPSRYDEGMNVYNTPLNLLRDCGDGKEQDGFQHITAAVVAYNMAQVKIKCGKRNHAEHWLHQALYWTKANDHFSQTLVVKILHCLGFCRYVTGEADMGMEYYQKAFNTSKYFKLGRQYLAASLNCIGVLQFSMDGTCNVDKSLQSFEECLQMYRSCKSFDPLAVATVHNNIGRLHYLRADYVQALQSYQESLKIRRHLLGEESIDVAATLYNAGQACQQLKKFEESINHYKSFLSVAKSVFGENSKDAALALKGIAEIHQVQGKFDTALEFFHQALQAQTAASGRLSTDVATLLNKIGNLCYEMKEYDTAMASYTEGLEIECSILPPDHPYTIITQTNIAHIHKQLDQCEKALEAYERVLKMQVGAFGSNALVLAETLSFIALMQYHLGDYASSLEAYQFALRIYREHSSNNDNPRIASTLNSIGLVFFKKQAYELANMCFSESLRIRTKLLGPNHRDVAILWYNLATVYFERGEEETAVKMYKETLRVEEMHLGADHPDVGLTLRHLGQVHQQLGKLEEAAKYFQQVVAIERKREVAPNTRSSLSKALNLLGNVYLQLNQVPEMMECYVEASRLNEAPRETSDDTTSDRLVIAGYNLYCLQKTNPPAAPIA